MGNQKIGLNTETKIYIIYYYYLIEFCLIETSSSLQIFEKLKISISRINVKQLEQQCTVNKHNLHNPKIIVNKRTITKIVFELVSRM